MAEKIVIVESNAKARTISRYLGEGFEVQACRGHIRDLPKDRFGVDVEQGFEPTYVIMPGSRSIVGKLRKTASDAQEIYLAPDPDREGEAIAWHLTKALNLPEEGARRVTFNEITREAILEAFQHTRSIDHNLVDAQQARRILDRIVGYELSPLISKKVLRGLSAGRVQSVALRLVVDRDREREAFEPQEYWEIDALLRPGKGKDTLEASLKSYEGEKIDKNIPTGEEAEKLVENLRGQDFAVTEVETKQTTSRPFPPFITSTMQQEANKRLRFSTSRTMRLAQQLYEGVELGAESVGLITYMRTDSTRIAKSALGACRGFIEGEHGDAYLPSKPNYFRSPKGAQAAHEAIRPTDVNRRPEDVRRYLSKPQSRLYELIWQRFVASQMTPARYEDTTVTIQAGPGIFEAKGRRLMFDGYTRVYRRRRSKKQKLPALEEGQALLLEELLPSQHFTQPPPRYTEATLVKELEKRGIGRPSTYAPTIRTILKRNYVTRDRRAFEATELGKVVCDLLVEHFPREMDYEFTSHMEEELDEIEEGKRGWRSTLEEFYEEFSRDLERAKQNMERVSGREPEEPVTCEECGKPMVIRFSKKGGKFLGCSGFPDCKNTLSLDGEETQAVETEHKCPKCGATMLRRIGRRRRPYLACSAFPECRNIMGLDREGNPVELEDRRQTNFSCPRCGQDMFVGEGGEAEQMSCPRCKNTLPRLSIREALAETEMPEEPLMDCPECGAPMLVRRGRRGLFLGCSNYPDCKGTAPIPADAQPDPQPTAESCEKCGRPMVVRWGRYGRFLSCSGFPRCRNLWRLPSNPDPCPSGDCEGELITKVSEDGEYLGCTRYPECDYTKPIEQEEQEED